MSEILRCNICFRESNKTTSPFSLTNCGHVFCEKCLQKGNKEVCGVCKSPCRIIVLSSETDPDIKMLFTDISVLCKTYSTEIIQVIEFQGSHKNRILTRYKRKTAKLERTIKELTKELQSCSLRAPQSHSRLPTSNTSRTIDSKDQYSPSVSQVSSANKVESMDFTTTAPVKKNITIPRPPRLSLISPAPSGLMGPHTSNITGGSLRSDVGSSQQTIFHPLSQSVAPANLGGIWNLSGLRSPQQVSQTPMSSQPPSARQPITLANILQRRH